MPRPSSPAVASRWPLVDGENTIPLIAAEDVVPPAVGILVGAKRSAGERIELVGQVMTPNETPPRCRVRSVAA